MSAAGTTMSDSPLTVVLLNTVCLRRLLVVLSEKKQIFGEGNLEVKDPVL